MITPMPNTITATELSRDPSKLIQRLANGPVFLTKSGKTFAVIISADSYADMTRVMADSELLSDAPQRKRGKK